MSVSLYWPPRCVQLFTPASSLCYCSRYCATGLSVRHEHTLCWPTVSQKSKELWTPQNWLVINYVILTLRTVGSSAIEAWKLEVNRIANWKSLLCNTPTVTYRCTYNHRVTEWLALCFLWLELWSLKVGTSQVRMVYFLGSLVYKWYKNKQ